MRRLGVFFFTVSLLLLNLEQFRGWPLVTRGHLSGASPSHLSHLSSPGRPLQIALPSPVAAVAFIPCNGTDGTGTVWPGVTGRLKHASLPASPLPLAGEESWRKGNLSSGQERQRAINGSRGNFFESRAPPGALPSQTAVTRRVRALAR